MPGLRRAAGALRMVDPKWLWGGMCGSSTSVCERPLPRPWYNTRRAWSAGPSQKAPRAGHPHSNEVVAAGMLASTKMLELPSRCPTKVKLMMANLAPLWGSNRGVNPALTHGDPAGVLEMQPANMHTHTYTIGNVQAQRMVEETTIYFHFCLMRSYCSVRSWRQVADARFANEGLRKGARKRKGGNRRRCTGCPACSCRQAHACEVYMIVGAAICTQKGRHS